MTVDLIHLDTAALDATHRGAADAVYAAASARATAAAAAAAAVRHTQAHRAGTATAARHAEVDPAAVYRAIGGDRPKFLTRAEKQAATVRLQTGGVSRAMTAVILRCGTAAVGRYRRDNHAQAARQPHDAMTESPRNTAHRNIPTEETP